MTPQCTAATAPMLVLSFLLASCGDGGGVASASAPAAALPPPASPPPPASTMPAQTFAAAANATLAVETVSQVFDPPASPANLPQTQNAGQWADSLTIARDDKGGYTVTLLLQEGSGPFAGERVAKTFAFPITSRSSSGGDQTVGEFTSAAAGNGSWDGTLQTDLASAANGRKYVNFARLTACNLVGGTGCAVDQYARALLVFGLPTPLSEIPLSGAASYAGRFFAPAPTGNDYIEGSIGLSLNFANRGITGGLTQVARYVDFDWNGAIVAEPDIALAGVLSAGGLLAGTLAPDASSNVTGGNWAANLFGPQAAEVGGTIVLEMKGGIGTSAFAGTFSGARQ